MALPVWGRSHTGTRCCVSVLPSTYRHCNLSLRQNQVHLCWGIHASCRSPVCSGCSWPSPSLVGMLPSMGVSVQGERTAHRCVLLHRDLGKKGGLEKSKHLRISVWLVNIWVQNQHNFYIILFTISALFSCPPTPPHPQDLMWPRVLLKTNHTQSLKRGRQSP